MSGGRGGELSQTEGGTTENQSTTKSHSCISRGIRGAWTNEYSRPYTEHEGKCLERYCTVSRSMVIVACYANSGWIVY